MSTMSFLRSVNIKSPKQAAELVKAIERSQKEPPPEMKFSRPVHEVRADELKNFLSKVKFD